MEKISDKNGNYDIELFQNQMQCAIDGDKLTSDYCRPIPFEWLKGDHLYKHISVN